MKRKYTLACADCGTRNYTAEQNKETQADRLEIKKFCKRCNAHTVHKATI